jgi:Phosphotransferase enzyme family
MGKRPVVAEREVAEWCRATLGSAPVKSLFDGGYLSLVQGLQLADGREVVVKIRENSPRFEGCALVHRRLFDAGFPCPEPLSGVAPITSRLTASAEALVRADQQLPDSGRGAVPFAEAFARLLALAPPPSDVPDLWPPLPWTGWNHEEGRLWPWPDDKDVDLNNVAGPAWVDDAGRRARDRLQAVVGAQGVGHGDWYAGNIRWSGNVLAVVHDWDSVIIDSEAAMVGFAAAVFPTTHAGDEATVEETDAFLAAYQSASGRRFSRDERETTWAAGVWLRAFDTKKQHAAGQPLLSLTENEAARRLRRASA